VGQAVHQIALIKVWKREEGKALRKLKETVKKPKRFK
jgi:hypothetical protein